MILSTFYIWLTRRCWCPVVGVGWGGGIVGGSGVIGTSIIVVVVTVLAVLRDNVVLRQVDGIDGAAKPSVRLHLSDIVLAVHPLTLPFTIQKHPLTRRCNLSKMRYTVVKMRQNDWLVFTDNYQSCIDNYILYRSHQPCQILWIVPVYQGVIRVVQSRSMKIEHD